MPSTKTPPAELAKLMEEGEKYIGERWIAMGCSWKGRPTKRDGKAVRCGHKHLTMKAAKKCADKMVKTKPGNCQTYRPLMIYLTMIRTRLRAAVIHR